MSSIYREIELSGDPNPDLDASRGKFWINVDPETRGVAIGVPIGDMRSATFNFTPDDWDQIVALINRVELGRGKVVSSKWAE